MSAVPNEEAARQVAQIVAFWLEDNDQWWFDRPEPLDLEVDHDPLSGAFIIEVPEAEWCEWTAAIATLDRLSAAWCSSARLDPTTGRTAEPCSTFGDRQIDYSALDPDAESRLWASQACTHCGHPRHTHADPTGGQP